MATVTPRSRSSGALSIDSKARYSASPLRLRYLVIAAVSEVLPWSIWPIVPMFTCGLVRSNFFLATGPVSLQTVGDRTLEGTASPVFMASGDARGHGAHDRGRTDDLFLTKAVLCRLSYVGPKASRMEPTTGLEPGTGGLQNRCSTN